MSKRRKKQKNTSSNSSEPNHQATRLNFVELEDNAEELFLTHIEQFTPPNKDSKKNYSGEPIGDSNTKNTVRKTKKSRQQLIDITIDLHGCTTAEAEQIIDSTLNRLREGKQSTRYKVRVITGKGLHSPNGKGVLSRHIHAYVSARFGHCILSIDEPPHAVQIMGAPLRGHFDFILQT